MMTSVFSFGAADKGQLGINPLHKNSYTYAQKINRISSSEIDKISCGFDYSLFLLKNGKIYSCGNNDYKQLGHDCDRYKPNQIQMLDDHQIIDVSAGMDHSAAVTITGKVFTWGCNSYCKLGRDKSDDYSIKLVAGLTNHCVVQVACGNDHTLALTKQSEIFSWGANRCGQLGLGNTCDLISTPQLIRDLSNLPVKHIAAGENFSFVLSPSGFLYSWGSNTYGQLGGDSNQSFESVPKMVKHLRKQPIAYVSVGQNHVAALSIDGGVFTWGHGRYGQLGHNNYENKTVPCKVQDLMGSVVSQVECGMNHTMAYVVSTGIVYTFGLGQNGQLGIDEAIESCNTAKPIKGPWQPIDRSQPCKISRQMNIGDVSPHIVKRFYGGGNHSIILANPLSENSDSKLCPDDLRIWDWQHPANIAVVNCNENEPVETPISIVNSIYESLFSSVACMSSSFLELKNNSSHISQFNHGLNLDLAHNIMSQFLSSQTKGFLKNLAAIMNIRIFNNIQFTTNYPSLECFRFFLIIIVSSILEISEFCDLILIPFSNSFSKIDKTPSIALDSWIGNLKPRYFKKFCMVFINAINNKIDKYEGANIKLDPFKFSDMESVFECLKKLHQINEAHNRIIHYNTFYISRISKVFDLDKSFSLWLSGQFQTMFSLFNYIFLFDGITKTNLMKIEARHLMTEDFRYLPGQISYHITVRRNNILGDTLAQLQLANQKFLKKPFRVNFMGEDACDEGGVMKELFLLVVPEVLNPDYGLFEMYPESRLCWFHQMTFEDNLPQFNAIGRLFGLAIYNNVMIDMHFPLVMFKKLLNEKATLDDLIELNPTLGKSLQDLLDYDQQDFEQIFMINFVISLECYGNQIHHDLVPRGSEIPVTLNNRQEYVDLYVDYILNVNVMQPFKHFKEGFEYTMHGRCLKFFKPLELQEWMVGSENYDWKELQKSCEYLGEYWEKHPVIMWFWESFMSLSIDEKKKFLRFLTGCDRIPINGMSDVKIKIQPVNVDDTHLPVAHTCYNLLDLPKYSSMSILLKKLKIAIENNEGFALV